MKYYAASAVMRQHSLFHQLYGRRRTRATRHPAQFIRHKDDGQIVYPKSYTAFIAKRRAA